MHSKSLMGALEVVDVCAHEVAVGQREVIRHIPVPRAKQSSGLIL